MAVGLLVAMTLPGLVVLLVLLALVEQLASRRGRRGLFSPRARAGLSAAGIDVLSAAVSPGHALHREQQRVEQHLRDDEGDREPA